MKNTIFYLCSIPILLMTASSSIAQQIPFARIDTFLRSLTDTAGIPGIAVAITREQDVVYSKAFGVANIQTGQVLTPAHTFHIASISKTFAATAVMQLVEKGRIGLDSPLVTYLPYFKLDDDRYRSITIKQMLNHTSGMPDVMDYEWEKAVADEGAAERYTRSLTGERLISAPGAEYHYSNMAFDVMADLVAKVAGVSFEQYVKDKILRPLEMKNSSFYYPETSPSLRTSPHTGRPPVVSTVYPYNRMHAPSSTLNTNVPDLSNWAIANMHNGLYKDQRILNPATHHMMMTPTFHVNRDRNIGLGWFMYPYKGTVNIEHGGSDLGYKSLLTLIPEQRIGIVILCNTEEARMYDIRNRIRDIVLSAAEGL